MSRQEVRFDFSDYQYEANLGCPTCEAIENKVGAFPLAMPETVTLLCKKHYTQFREWHDKEVKEGNIKSWF